MEIIKKLPVFLTFKGKRKPEDWMRLKPRESPRTRDVKFNNQKLNHFIKDLKNDLVHEEPDLSLQ